MSAAPSGPGRQPEEVPYRPFGQQVIGAMVVSVLLVTALAVVVDVSGSGGEGAGETAEAGAGETPPPEAAAPVTVTTAPPAPAPAAVLGATATALPEPTTATAPPEPTTTTAPPETTTTTAPPPVDPVSAAAPGPGVTLTLEVTPAEGPRSAQGRLSVAFEDLRVLRGAQADYGDGTVLPLAVHPFDCNAPDAPNPYGLTLPAHTYAAPGTYPVTVAVTTAVCNEYDDDWGPEATSEVQVHLAVP